MPACWNKAVDGTSNRQRIHPQNKDDCWCGDDPLWIFQPILLLLVKVNFQTTYIYKIDNFSRKHAAFYKIQSFQRNIIPLRLNRDYFSLLTFVMILDQGVNASLEAFYVSFNNDA